MPGWLLILALQAAPAPAAPAAPQTDTPQRFSVLVPIPDEPCVRRPSDSDVLVCGNPLPSQKLPYPDEVVPDGPTPSNPLKNGVGALNAQGTPCPISRNCVVGFGPPIVPIITGIANAVGSAFKKKPDKTGRVPIPLDDSQKPTGKLEP